ncbi:MAG: hypothetical protein ACLVB1_01895 [Blautia obeum]
MRNLKKSIARSNPQEEIETLIKEAGMSFLRCMTHIIKSGNRGQ